VQEVAGYDFRGKLSLDAAACLAIRRPDTACESCAATCPAAAVIIDARAVELDHDTCIGCGRCVAACPTGALRMPLVSVDETVSDLILECSRVSPADRAAGAQIVPCLGGFGALQIRNALRNSETVSLMDRGWCADCAAGGHGQPWADAVKAVSDDLTELELDEDRLRVHRAPLPHERAQPAPQPRRPIEQAYSRRQLFRRLTTPAPAPDRRRVAAPQPYNGKADAPALHARALQLRAWTGTEALSAALFPALAVSGSPDLRLAASLCPTEALQLRENPEADRLIFDAALCLACGKCEAAGGIALQNCGSGEYAGPATLFSRSMADCPHCLRRFAPHAGQLICDACHKDNDLAASAFGLMRRTQMPYGA
jgi:ferredoxin